jgi:hypothetical protein
VALFVHLHCQLCCLWAGLLCQAPLRNGRDESDTVPAHRTGGGGDKKQGWQKQVIRAEMGVAGAWVACICI